ncbi:aspartate/glutamate racemase family protein [uncultured Limosilactobacillus sp.]|uniref:aspartate/glutamate racemase family protein n=1 Tax=uncultured Limosilactobacillus sp. TaxID=2837629 RepID=UPI0025F723B8|nr:amino acid racemase [uncultured Limosilactobacillus sp.]
MTKLGLIGGTGPESTLIYYQQLTSRYAQALHQDAFPPVMIESLDVFQVLAFSQAQNYTGLTNYLVQGFENLAQGGATFAALTGITPHVVFDQVQERLSIPLVSMVDTTVDYLNQRGRKQVLLLGTYPTMHETFVSQKLESAGIEVIKPTEDQQQFIHRRISDELEFGVVKASTQHEFAQLCQAWQDQVGYDAVILGCTELPLLFEKITLPVEKVDVMHVHIDNLLKRLVQEAEGN